MFDLFLKDFFPREIRNSALHISHFTISSLHLSTSLRGFITLNYWIICGHTAMTSDLFSSSFARFDFWSGAAHIGPRGPILPTFTCHCPVTLHCACLESWHQLNCSWKILSFFFLLNFLLGPHAFLLFAFSQPKVNIGSYPKDQQGLGRACGSACDDHQCLTSCWAGRTCMSFSLSLHPL